MTFVIEICAYVNKFVTVYVCQCCPFLLRSRSLVAVLFNMGNKMIFLPSSLHFLMPSVQNLTGKCCNNGDFR